MPRRLYFDTETYSPEDIKSTGAYKYIESGGFQLLIVSFAFDTSPVQVIDLAKGEELPDYFISALTDPGIEKWAHNAVFERLVFKRIGLPIPIDQLYCSMTKAAYCGLPLALDELSKALVLGEHGKKSTGKALIRFFCSPCKPTKSNGMRTRNMPDDDPDKWSEFKTYAEYDVIAEREIVEQLDQFPFPEFERRNYLVDQSINDRGILIDLDMAGNAISFDEVYTEEMTDRMKELTGLDNPNSLAQLKTWLSTNFGLEFPALGKPEILEYFKNTPDAPDLVKEVLGGRLALSKTSTKKYIAMLNCAAKDQRAHGLFQFYGANRTGRWSSRMIQLQNLPQNHMKDLDLARSMVEKGDYDLIEMCYGNIPNVLSELIRTAFIAPEGKMFAVADFSAIEARVLSWLAQEKWRLDVFNTHGKIYEASASLMFGVPIEQVTKGSDLRQRGKTAELALGYEGSVNAMEKMDKEKKLSKKEMYSIVALWRRANPKIVEFWAEVNEKAIECVQTRKTKKVSCLVFEHDGTNLTIALPAGRKLYYRNPRVRPNRFGQTGIVYDGMVQSVGWTEIETYGGKLVENIVQAISRDLLAEAMYRLSIMKDFEIVMHVHDEAIAEVDEDRAGDCLETMCRVMGEDLPWLNCLPMGLPLKADGYVTKFYKKD